MKYMNILKKTLWAVLAAGVIMSVSIPVQCSEIDWFDDTTLDEYIKQSNEAAKSRGVTTNNTPNTSGSKLATTQSGSTGSSESSEGRTNEAIDKSVRSCEHAYVDSIISEPTCAESGIMESKCSKCGDTYKTEIPATGKHEYTSEITKEATCTEKGETTYTCTVCGDSYTEELPAKGHSYVSSVTKEATCTEAGITTFTCSECGDSYTEEIPALGHTEVEEVTKEAGIFTNGEKVVKCSTCGETLNTEIIPSRYPISVLFIALGIILVALIAVSVIFVKMKKGKNNKTSAA